ncbi:hypothetical protein O181_044812 [Austropuccinia psidii MF-1]|uniref:Uncharacterized protein n=1 Tax=Austropuccinia psidii MF-1 TaxID=1389203 RepID=A0A9Q3DSK0_9BASI|nr:hypothetical protein [Austropuccinia psidii MF-1]
MFAVRPFSPCGQRSSRPRRPCEDSFVVNNDESIPEREWIPGPQTGRREQFQTISLVPSSINLTTPPPRPPSDEQNQPNPPRQDSPVPSFPRKKTLRQPTPGLSGTQWLEDLFREPSRTNEPSIPGPSPSSKPHEDVRNREPEP